MTRGLVSVVIPCYNSGRFIVKLLESLLIQDYRQIQVIAINDGSSDNTEEILQGYIEKFKRRGYELKILNQKNLGAAAAINSGLEHAGGEYITFIDSDDYVSSQSIGARVKFLSVNRSYDAVYSRVGIVDFPAYQLIESKAGEEDLNTGLLFTRMLKDEHYIWPPVAYMIRSRLLKQSIPALRIEESRVGQNIQLFLPMWYNAKIGYIDECLGFILSHADSHSRQYRGEDEASRQTDIKKLYLSTLEKMNIDDDYRDICVALIEERYSRLSRRKFIDIHDGRDELSRLYQRDEHRFRQSHFSSPESATELQLASRLVFSSHSLEKSLSNDGFEVGHGFMVVRLLVGFLDIYKSRGYSLTHLGYISTLSTLRAFHNRHEGTEHQKEIEVILGDWTATVLGCEADIGGASAIPIRDKKNNRSKNFKELAENRYAIRSYADRPVDDKLLDEVLKIATKTPSVCNRQPVRVRVMRDKSVIAKVLEVQGGIAHYETPPILFLITSDDRSYVGVNERNQGYVDGGLFAMSMLYALEYVGLAACPLHAMFETERDFKVRGLLDIPDNEKIITFISAGHFNQSNNVCKSFRYPVSYIAQSADKINEFDIETILVQSEQSPTSEEFIVGRRGMVYRFLRKVKRVTRIRTRARRVLSIARDWRSAQKYSNYHGAILTLTGYFNYGNVVQRFALQQVLKKNGYKFVSYVDPYSAPMDMYRTPTKTRVRKPVRFLKRLATNRRPYWYTPTYGELYPEARQQQNLIQFVNDNIDIKRYSSKDKFKNYIVGSDQVWRNWWGDQRKLGYYFLDFIRPGVSNKIAYAASMGMSEVKDAMSVDDIAYLRPYVKDFDHISMRERSAAKSVSRTWGLESVSAVLDPTLLLSADDYSSLIEKSSASTMSTPPVFAYLLGQDKKISSMVERLASKIGKKYDGINAHTQDVAELEPVECWLKGFRDAELVVTNSFHGMMLSVVNNTDFVVVGREVGGLSRIIDFLDEYDLMGRFVSESNIEDFNIDSMQAIDWGVVNKKLDEQRNDSTKWLLNAIR